MIGKRKIAYYLVLALSIIIFGVFTLTPIDIVLKFIVLISSTIGHLLIFLRPGLYNKVYKKWYSLGVSFIIVSILSAYLIYNQGFVSGFVAVLSFYNIGTVNLIYYLLIRYEIPLAAYFQGLCKLGWLNLFLMIGMFITGYEFVNTTSSGDIVVDAHRLNNTLITFSAIYYLCKFLKDSNYKHLFFTVLLFSASHLGEIQRVSLLVQIFIILLAVLKYRNIKTKLRVFNLSFFVIFILGFFLFSTEAGLNTIDRFYQAFSVLVIENSDEISDASSSVRIKETEFALEQFSKSPIIGNGMLRASLAEELLGNIHFYPSDIGIFGVLYLFGIFGLIANLLQYKYALKWIKKIKYDILNVAVLFLTLLMINNITTAVAIFKFVLFLWIVLIIELHCNRDNTLSFSQKGIKHIDNVRRF